MARFGDRKCLAIGEDRFLTRFHFCDFCGNEFFNSYAWFQQLTFALPSHTELAIPTPKKLKMQHTL
jgi:hypothetical protein